MTKLTKLTDFFYLVSLKNTTSSLKRAVNRRTHRRRFPQKYDTTDLKVPYPTNDSVGHLWPASSKPYLIYVLSVHCIRITDLTDYVVLRH